MINVGQMFRDIVMDISNPAAKQSTNTTETSTPVEVPVPNNNSSSEAALIASVVGGKAEDYEDLVRNCSGLELDDMIDAALAMKSD